MRIGVLLILAMMAEVQRNDGRVRRWSYEALDAATREGELRTEIALFAIPHLLADGRFRDAAELHQAMAHRARAEGATFDANELAASFVVTPALLRIAAANSDRGELAKALHAVCEEQAATTRAKIWQDCADVIHTTFLADADIVDRLSQLRRIKVAQQVGTETAALVTNIIAIGASVLPGTPLTASLAYQAEVQNEIVERLQHFEAIFRRFVIPFFASFWLGKIDSHPDAFHQNDVAKSRIATFSATATPNTVRAILVTVARHLDLNA